MYFLGGKVLFASVNGMRPDLPLLDANTGSLSP